MVQRPNHRSVWISLLLLFLLVSCGEGTAPVSVPKARPALEKKKTESYKPAEKKEGEK